MFLRNEYVGPSARKRPKSPANWLFVRRFVQNYFKENSEALHNWPFERGIHWRAIDSLHKGPVLWKMFPCHHVSCFKLIYFGIVAWRHLVVTSTSNTYKALWRSYTMPGLQVTKMTYVVLFPRIYQRIFAKDTSFLWWNIMCGYPSQSPMIYILIS